MVIEHTREARQERLSEKHLHTFELASLVEGLRREEGYARNGRMGTVVIKTADLRVVVQALRAGARLEEHQAPGPISVQVLEGEIRFRAEEEEVTLRPGDLMVLPTTRLHAVEAVVDSAFLLTIAPVQAK